MAYKIPAQEIKNYIFYGDTIHPHSYSTFIKTIRKQDLKNFYKYYGNKDRELKGSKDEMFKIVKEEFLKRVHK